MAYATDIGTIDLDEEVSITGYVVKRRVFSTHLSVRVRDITGSILIEVPRVSEGAEDPWPKSMFPEGARISVLGRVKANTEGERLIYATEVHNLGRIHSRLSELDAEMREQASRMLISRVSSSLSRLLQNQKFVQFRSSVISLNLKEAGLQGLRVAYPGFGSPVSLAISPSAQVMEYLHTTGERRAFTESVSFSTTYRFANGSTEIPVTVSKSLDMDSDQHRRLLGQLATKALDAAGIDLAPSTDRVSPRTLHGWGPSQRSNADDARFALYEYAVDIPVFGRKWESTVRRIIHVYDNSGTLLMEGAEETIGSNVSIRTVTAYPTQFLQGLTSRPDRRLRDLEQYHIWEGEP
jgi:hypothetical protein